MATWIGQDGAYNDANNWTPANIPDGVETATFTNNGATTTVVAGGVSFTVDGFTFDANSPTYSFSLSGSGVTLGFTGAGIVNNSGVAQNLSTGTGSSIQFQQSATAGNATITVNANTFLQFQDTSSGGTASLVGNGGIVVM